MQAVSSARRTLFGGEDGGSSSFLARIKQTLAHASTLIATCEGATAVRWTRRSRSSRTRWPSFVRPSTGLAEATVDITLIGMNAGLKASHLGSRGSAFVVIANELKATADQGLGRGGTLETGARRHRALGRGAEAAPRAGRINAARASSSRRLLQALREVEAGNERLGKLMSRLVVEGAEFEGLMNSAQGQMNTLAEGSAALPAVAARLETATVPSRRSPTSNAGRKPTLDALFCSATRWSASGMSIATSCKRSGWHPRSPPRGASKQSPPSMTA